MNTVIRQGVHNYSLVKPRIIKAKGVLYKCRLCGDRKWVKPKKEKK